MRVTAVPSLSAFLPTLAASLLLLLGCAGSRWLPEPPPDMLAPAARCPVEPPPAPLLLPEPAQGSGRVLLLRPDAPDELGDQVWAALRDELEARGHDVSPYARPEGFSLACDEEEGCDLTPLVETVGDPSAFDWLVDGRLVPGASGHLAAYEVDGLTATRVRKLDFMVVEGDLILAVAGPRQLARELAEHQSPPGPPTPGELDDARCVVLEHDAAGCPEFHPPEYATVALLPIPTGAPRVVWRDLDLEIALPLDGVRAQLRTMAGDDWDQRRAEWAASRLQHLQRLARAGEPPWLSSWVEGNVRDARMDTLVYSLVADGVAEVHECGESLAGFLWVDPDLRLPGGRPLPGAPEERDAELEDHSVDL